MDDDTDRNVEEEIARNLWAHHKMLPPESKFKKYWNKIITFLVMYTCFSVPLLLGFHLSYEPGQMAFDYLVDCFFITDILLTFRTTFFDADNELVLDKKLIRKMYMRQWFWVDVVATLPLELIGLAVDGRLLLDFRLLRMLRLFKLFKQIDVHNNVLRVSQMLVFFMFVAHWVGSGWWALGVAPYNVSPDGNPTGTTWVVRANVCPSERNETDDDGGAYCERMPDGSPVEFWQKYMSSLYWSLTTLIKTPWVHPDTVGEKAVASIIVVFGAILFAAILGNITAMINSFDKSNAQLRDIMSTLHRLIGKYDVPTKLQKRVFMYVQTQWSTTKGLDNQRILAKVPPALRGDILEAIHDDLIKTSPIFVGVSSECVRVILSKLRSEVCLAKETLIAGGQLCNEVYLLVRGVLQVQLDADGEKGAAKAGGGGGGGGGAKKPAGGKMGRLAFKAIEKTGALVGMRDPFEKDCRYPFHVTAVKQAQLVVLSAKDLMDVFSMDNRNDIEAICEALEKEHSDIATALAKGSDQGGDGRRGSRTGRRRSSHDATARSMLSGHMSDHEEVHSRLAVIDDTLRTCDAEIRTIQEHLQLLPQLCELLNISMSGNEPDTGSAPAEE